VTIQASEVRAERGALRSIDSWLDFRGENGDKLGRGFMLSLANFVRCAANPLICSVLIPFLIPAASLVDTRTNVAVHVMSTNLTGNTQSYEPFAPSPLAGLAPGWTLEPLSGLVEKTQNSENKQN
jgi:hypothetical protein